jgi:hypothetical protein
VRARVLAQAHAGHQQHLTTFEVVGDIRLLRDMHPANGPVQPVVPRCHLRLTALEDIEIQDVSERQCHVLVPQAARVIRAALFDCPHSGPASHSWRSRPRRLWPRSDRHPRIRSAARRRREWGMVSRVGVEDPCGRHDGLSGYLLCRQAMRPARFWASYGSELGIPGEPWEARYSRHPPNAEISSA